MFRKQKILTIIIFGFSLIYTNLTFAQQTPPPTTPPPSTALPQEKAEKKFKYNKFGIGLFYNFADTPKLKLTASNSGVSGTGDAKYESEGAPGLLFYGDSRFNKWWGLEYGVGYEFERTVKKIMVEDTQLYPIGDEPEITMTIFYFQINGKFFPADNFYILFGFNLNSMDLKNSLVELDMGFGGQIGLGFQISKNFALEAQYQMFYSDYKKSVTIDSASVTADGFSLDGVKGILRYSF